MSKTKVAIVDDHNLFREGLGFLLTQSKDISIVGEASNGEEFIKSLDKLNPDLVLMDIEMPVMNGIEAAKKAIELRPDLKIIALSMYDDQEYYYKMIHAGVKGFILKKTNANELFSAINKVMSGENYFSADLLKSIIINLSNIEQEKSNTNSNLIKFSKRETDVLHLICKGLSSKEIAEKLFLSSKTVEGHKYNLFNKTGVNNTVSLVMYAIKNNLVEIS